MTRTTTSAADILRAAREKIAKPEAWTRDHFAADQNGEFVYATDPAATCWCAEGAVVLAREEVKVKTPDLFHGRTAGFWLSMAARSLGYETASKLNDDPKTTHADVLALFDLAIRLAEMPDA